MNLAQLPISLAKRPALRSERVLIWVKDISDETLLAVVSAIQGFPASGKLKFEGWCSQRSLIPTYIVAIDLVLPDSKYVDIICKLVPEVKCVHSDFSYCAYHMYDAIFDLSESNARELGQATTKHLANSFGILLGHGDQSIFPDLLENLCTSHTPSGRILTSHAFIEQCEAFSIPIPPDRFIYTENTLTLEQRIRNVFECDGVIDVPSFETYLAAGLAKPVLEYSNDLQLTKWSSKSYHLLTELTADGLKRGIKICFPSIS